MRYRSGHALRRTLLAGPRRALAAGLAVVIMLSCGVLAYAAPAAHRLIGAPQPNAASLPSTHGASDATLAQARQKIKHVVFVILENHTFDSVFGRYPGADGATSASVAGVGKIPMLHAPSILWHDISHERDDTYKAMDNGKMDKFSQIFGGDFNGDHWAYLQYDQADIPNFWSYAQRFALGDHMFSSVAGSTFPNHLYAVAAQSGGITTNVQNWNHGWGCDSGPQAYTLKLIPKTGKIVSTSPCVDFH